MRKSLLVLTLLALAASACDQTTGDATNICVETPSVGGDAMCDIPWSCNSDVNHYELRCSFNSGLYDCQCLVEGESVKSFTVSPFDCTSNGAIPAASAGCGWNITLE